MKVRVSRKTAIRLYCVVKQAARSLHPALAPKQWPDLIAYYNAQRRSVLSQMLGELGRLLPVSATPWPVARLCKRDVVWMALAPALRFVNRRRSAWRFPAGELAFVRESLRCLLEALRAPTAPPGPWGYELRIALDVGAWVFERRLIGCPALDRAARIEHFSPAPGRAHLTLDDVLACVA
jgi:hypothetical protein